MTIRTSPWPAGVPCWTDLSSPDITAATDFYSAVLGWEFDTPAEEYGGYVIATRTGQAVAGIGPLQPGAHPAWTLYFASDDADTTSAEVRRQGGSIIVEPGDVGEMGRMFIAADPTGAAFGVWQAGTHIGASLVNEPGGLTWEDLRSPEPDAARSFYTGVFGYRTDPIEMAGPDYMTFALANESAPLGGIGGMFGQDAPPHWMVYFGVADAAESAAAAERHGGAVTMQLAETPYGPMAGLTDPSGAALTIVQVSPDQPRPDRAG